MGLDDEFAAAGAGPAQFYRTKGMQIVPAYIPGEQPKGLSWKRPRLNEWVEYQEALIPDDLFNSWYGPGGLFVSRENMGMICGRASDNLFVIDLDLYKKLGAAEWWSNLMLVHNNSMELETVEQVTGGGGRQKMFRAPPSWVVPNKAIHSLGIDIKGQGGFVMLAPSLHESGRHYAWVDGQSPEDIEPTLAPDWLLEAVEALVGQQGENPSATKAFSPRAGNGQGTQSAYDGFGHQVDGRETYMRDMVWRVMLDWSEACPIKPSAAESARKAGQEYEVYEREVNPQQSHPADLTKTQMLDREGRGWNAWWIKWQAAMRKWDDDVYIEARRKDRPRDKAPAVYRETIDPATGQPLPLILPPAQFVASFVPPDYVVDGMLQRGYLVSLTARTGHGKTAVMMYMGTCIARGVPFHGRPTEQGGVLFLAGENPDDIRARYLALAQHEGFDPGSIPFYFVDGVIDIKANMERIRTEVAQIPNLSLVMIDTQAAYFFGDEGNSNEQQGQFARDLRTLTKLPGKPAAVVNCHPTKNATQDNLVPMGGSAFLNEVDANLTLWAEDRACTLGPHPDKWRGVAMESMAFELRTLVSDRLKDTKGRHIPSVVALPITEGGAERRAQVAQADEDAVLRLMNASRGASLTMLARGVGFFLPDGSPAKAKVQRVMERLKRAKLIYNHRGTSYRLTRKGCKEIGVKWKTEDDDTDFD